MYWLMKASEDRFIWDDQKEKMYRVQAGIADVIPPSLMMLSKFRTDLELDRKEAKKPASIAEYEANTEKRLQGK